MVLEANYLSTCKYKSLIICIIYIISNNLKYLIEKRIVQEPVEEQLAMLVVQSLQTPVADEMLTQTRIHLARQLSKIY